jgi:hypothetical protein
MAPQSPVVKDNSKAYRFLKKKARSIANKAFASGPTRFQANYVTSTGH